MLTRLANQPDAVNPAIASRLHSEYRWRGVTDPERSGALGLIWLTGILMPLFVFLGSKTGHSIFYVLAVLFSFAGLGLMFYAGIREKKSEDRSETVSPRAAVTIFFVIGLWVVFIVVHALSHRSS
jgi:predicted ABC-type exoprotein transport system permease subunit